jgi:rubrerythrin
MGRKKNEEIEEIAETKKEDKKNKEVSEKAQEKTESKTSSKKHVCLLCGYTHEGDEAPNPCPVCGQNMWKSE